MGFGFWVYKSEGLKEGDSEVTLRHLTHTEISPETPHVRDSRKPLFVVSEQDDSSPFIFVQDKEMGHVSVCVCVCEV